ncbi:MMPL family transporter [Myxococcus sp. CA039A]|uniref:MMPL family transporter n=1 Tax=Myxococcus sp. CA039A TaxID=2741737 RepID=UPI00157A3E7F|nr:MMPL family transporter [Myxococcus sp. CA039A]NTX35597.1 MMPL family transporter [Myxococcus sp. CA033]NTX50793.1 MMPL family transporter [Myxococcus sp. CA039A]
MRNRAAILWLLVVLAVGVHQVQFWRSARLDTDVLALLPEDEQAPEVDAATRKLADQAGRELVLLVGAPDWASAQRAADLVTAELSKDTSLLSPSALDASSLDAALELYRPYRDRLLTPAQRTWLSRATPEELGGTALMKLYQPAGPHLTDWEADPLGLWPDWWAARASESTARPRDGRLWLSGEGREWVLLAWHSQVSAFALGADGNITTVVDRARAAVTTQVPGSRVVAAGVPLYAEAAASQASNEMSTIGIGSLVAVLVLVWLTFRSVRPIILVGVSLGIGCAVAMSVTALVFERVHLLTLVFGSSLVGVAEDYGFHYFAARQGKPPSERGPLMRSLLPGMVMALLTSVVAYLALGVAPFPGLRQMALFSATGLVGAFLTVACWFPTLDTGALPVTSFSTRFATSLARWPRFASTRAWWVGTAALVLFIIGGLWRVRTRDDVRQLQGAPAHLIADQRELGRLLGLPSPAQFFLVGGQDEEQVLAREASLKARLDPLVTDKVLAGYRAVSDWLPSAEQQRSDAKLSARAEAQAVAAVAQATGEEPTRARFADDVLTPERLLASPASAAIRQQWLGRLGEKHFSIVMLRGLNDPSVLPRIADAAQGLEGVRWVDKTQEISRLLERYRRLMGGLILLGYVAVLLLLVVRFRREAWRAWLPTVVGTLVTLAVFGWVGEPLQLFSVLGLMLLLGMGVDYGIFMLEHPGEGSAWLAVALAGVSTLLSFGLLGLSATPALRSFGLTMLLGEVTIWLLTPCCRLPPGKDVS